jgi:hypothetical protein
MAARFQIRTMGSSEVVGDRSQMTPDQVQLMRRLTLNEREATDLVMSGALANSLPLDSQTAALVRMASLLSLDSDPSTFHWAADLGVAAGVEDDSIFRVLLVVAPLIGVARLSCVLPRLMEALGLDPIDS